MEGLRTESKHTIMTEQLRSVEGIARAICDRINLKDPSQYVRLPSTPGDNSLFQYGGKEGSTSQSRAPSQTPRVGLISSSPPGERFHFVNFPESVFDKASQPRYGHRFGFGTSIDQNDGSTKSSSNDVKQGSRLLIDAYGGNDTSHEKLPKVQRLNAYQGMTNLQCNEEDMYAWKNMSPILSIQGKELKLGPPRPNVGSNRENAALPEKEFKTSRPSQPFLPRPDICANDLLKMQLLTYVWGPQFEQRKYTNRQRLYLSEQLGSSIRATQVHKSPTPVLI